MKDWYLHVQEETMAPARMMQFADKHIKYCGACQQDPDLSEEIEKIRELILPESKIPKAERNDETEATPDISPDEENIEDEENGEKGSEEDELEKE